MRRALVAARLISAACLVSACAPATPSLDSLASGYAQAALRLAQHDRALVDGWRGPERMQPGPRGPVKQVAEDIAALQDDAARAGTGRSSPEDQARLRYLTIQLSALRFAADRQLGRAATIDEQAKEEFALELPPLDAPAVRRTLAEIDQLLPGKESLAERVRALRARIRVPRDKTRDVFQAALSACKDVSAPVFPLPAHEAVELRFSTFQQHQGWDGFADHTDDFRTQIWINDEVPLDVSRALRLACHEGYPGHHVQHVLIDQLFESRQWMELRLTPVFGRHLLLSEARRKWRPISLFQRTGAPRSIARHCSPPRQWTTWTPASWCASKICNGSCCRSSPMWRAGISPARSARRARASAWRTRRWSRTPT